MREKELMTRRKNRSKSDRRATKQEYVKSQRQTGSVWGGTYRCVSTLWQWWRQSGSHHTDDMWCGRWCDTALSSSSACRGSAEERWELGIKTSSKSQTSPQLLESGFHLRSSSVTVSTLSELLTSLSAGTNILKYWFVLLQTLSFTFHCKTTTWKHNLLIKTGTYSVWEHLTSSTPPGHRQYWFQRL